MATTPYQKLFRTLRKYSCGPIVSILLVVSPGLALADASDFMSWLKKHGAHEALEIELSEKDQTPEVMLERAKTLLKLGRASEAATLLRSSPAFDSAPLEHERLWLLGTAFRQAGDLPTAVAAWSMAAGTSPSDKEIKRLASEPGFPSAWQDVCRHWVWIMLQTPDKDSAQALDASLRSALTSGRTVWPEDAFWPYLEEAFSAAPASSDSLSTARPDPGLIVSGHDRTAIARALALFALGDGRGAQDMVDAISEDKLKQCWRFFFETLSGWKSPAFAAGLRSEGYLLAASFFEGLLPAQLPAAATGWLIPDPLLVHWPRINARLALATPEQAAEIIATELGGSEVDPLSAERLRQIELAHALAVGDETRMKIVLGQLDPDRLALPLKLGLVLVHAGQPRNFFKSQDAKPGLGLVLRLAEAAGLSGPSPSTLPFWTRLTPDEALEAAKTHPFDQLLQLAALETQWAKSPSPDLAKRVGFLFPQSPSGIEALVTLATQAGKTGNLEASAAYLNLIIPDRVVGPVRIDWLQAKAALEIEIGLDERALASYAELYRLDRERFTPAKLLRFALLAQQQEQHELARQVLLDLWRDKDGLSSADQAETLFWLAESSEFLGLQNEALRDYLRVAWRYPEENMWAVTALYRAALIYERTGRVAPAKDLLAMVVKNSDRKSQRDQAEQRLLQLEQRGKSVRSGGTGSKDGGGYPF